MQELQQQVLSQAVELDECQRDTGDAFALRQQLATAQAAEAALRREAAALRQALGAPSDGGGRVAAQQRQQREPSARHGSQGGHGGAAGAAGRLGARAGGRQTRGVKRAPPPRAGRTVLHAPAPAAACPLTLFSRLVQIARLRADRDQLRDDLDVRDTEVMTLQGQLAMAQAAAHDDNDNWLSPLPDPSAL